MSDYQRSTRECTLDSMNPALETAVHQYIETHQLGSVLSHTQFCGETTSTRQKKGLFGRKSESSHTGFWLAPPWLIWATAKEGEATAVLAARLRDIQVQDYERSEMVKLVPDSGINITGLRQGDEGVGTAFIGLGPEPAAQTFRERLRQAVDQAK